MRKSSTFSDILRVTFSNCVSLASSILNGFVIPVILGTLNYGYYKIFILYASYTTLLHFGFNDGLVLSYGGENLNDLNHYKFRANSIFFIYFQFLISIIIIVMALFTTNYFYKILFIFLGINCFIRNLFSYYQNISMMTMRFHEFSIINTIQYLSLIVIVLIILVMSKIYGFRNISFVPYVIITISITAILDFWYLYIYRGITFGKHPSLISQVKNFKKYFISGIYMTLGYAVSVLIFNLDSQFVVKFFSTRTYGIYAFAYSLFSAGLTILTSAAFVLLPHLKRHSKNYILAKYGSSISIVNLVVYLAIVGYFPLKLIIHRFIYEYYGSLIYFRLLLPGMVITCCVSIVISNYYYALKKGKFYFYLNLIVLFISFLIDTCAYLLFKSPESLAFSSTLSLVVWYVLSNHFMVRWFNVKWVKNLSYLIIMMIIFLLVTSIDNILLGIGLYLLLYLIVSIILFKRTLYQLLSKFKSMLISLI